jgi:hypothetical protein
MEPPNVKKTIKFKYQGHSVTMHILAYREPDDYLVQSCIADFVRSYKRKKLRNDITITFPTLFGATDLI